MKFFKWRIFVITALACLLPILLGMSLWESLPESIAIHFDIYGTPDNFAPKAFVVFGIPMLMVVLQAFCCFVSDLNDYKKGESVKFTMVAKWIIPVVNVILYVVTSGVALGWNIDIRKTAMLIVGAMFLVMGNYLPKLHYIKHYNTDTEKARKINRFTGYGMVIMGTLFLISIFLPPVYSVVCLILLIPCSVICTVYGIKTAKK